MPAVKYTHLTSGGPIMPARPLTLHEREEIRVGIERREPDGVIAQRLGRHRLTVNAEIARNGGRPAYVAIGAQGRCDEERRRPKQARLVADAVLAAHVTSRLEARDSPMTISRELASGVHGVTGSLSHESIYRAIYAHGTRGLRKGLSERLHRRRRCRRHRRHKGATSEKVGPLGQFNPIATRPAIALERTEVGHLEGDLIVGAYNRSAIVTVFDRTSRNMWLADFPHDHGADATLAAMVEILERIPAPLRRTLTWDQGREMARHHDLAELCGIDVYFADPHSPWQRPTNENGNGLLRRYVGKGTDLSRITTRELRAIEHRINTMPRRSLHWSSAHDVYTAAVALTG
jgi:transposase, IS30 family